MSTIEFPPRPLSINDKVSILTDLRAGCAMRNISIKHQISPGQILLIAAKEQSIWDLFRSEYFKLAEQMTLKTGTYPRMENILFQWYVHHPRHYCNADFIEKARSIVSITEEKPSRSSKGFIGTISWVNGFKKRYNVVCHKGKKGSMLCTANVSTANVSTATSQILNETTGEIINDIKLEKYSNEMNESNTTEGIFFSPSFVEVQINETSNPSNVIPASNVNENSVLNSTPVELDVADKPVKSPCPNKKQLPKRTKRVNTMKPNWALQVFTQALKWTKENPTDEGDIRVLRKLHSRCLLSMNSERKIKQEKD